MLKKCQDEEWKIYAEWGLDLPPISVQLKIINQAESDKAMKNEAAIISMLSIRLMFIHKPKQQMD